jgi:hypothetical protein
VARHVDQARDLTPESSSSRPEEQAAFLLVCRQCGSTSARRLARAAELSVALVETLLCRALATLVARGYPAGWLCQNFTLTPEQLTRAAKAPPFGPEFEPTGVWLEAGPPARQETAAVVAEPETIGEVALIAELTRLLHLPDEPEALPAARAAAG